MDISKEEIDKLTLNHRGILWKIINSWWILLVFTSFLSFAGFLYVGMLGYKRSWKISGFVYLFASIIVIALSSLSPTLGGLLFFAISIISIVHAFRICNTFLKRLDLFNTYKKEANERILAIEHEEKRGKREAKYKKQQQKLKADSSLENKINTISSGESGIRKAIRQQIMVNHSSFNYIKKYYDETGSIHHSILISFKRKIIDEIQSIDFFSDYTASAIDPIIEEEILLILRNKRFFNNEAK